MKRIIILIAFFSAFLGYSQIITAPTIIASADSYVNSGTPAGIYGSLTTLKIQANGSGTAVTRAYLKFDLSSIPANVVITSARLCLVPNGTENVSPTNATELYLEACNSAWVEKTISYAANVVGNDIFSAVTTSNLVSSVREFQVKDHVQAMIDGRLPNNGWRIRRTSETSALNTTYESRESAGKEPTLIIQYYSRAYVSAATIVHTSTLSKTDGSISPTVTGGSGTRTYAWYDASGTQIATTQDLTGIGKGWYGMKSTGADASDVIYQAFLVGTECENVSVSFNPGPDYIDDALLMDRVTGSGTTAVNYGQQNIPSRTVFMDEKWNDVTWNNGRALMRFRLWIDPNCQVNTADLTLTGAAHDPAQITNASELLKVTSDWNETGVANVNAPTSTATGKISIAGIAAGNSNLTLDIASFFNSWKIKNDANYGMLFQLQSYTANSNTRMQFRSSDNATAANRPQIAFTFTVNTCNLSRKGTTTVSYASTNDYADLSTTIDPPSWSVSPYHYIISEQPVPDFSEIYRTFKYGDPSNPFKDTVFIDSTTFFNMGETALTKPFSGLRPGQYFVSVFDKLGVRIYNQQVSVNPMNYETFSNMSFSALDDQFTSSAANGKALMYSFMNENSEGASVSFSLPTNTGETLLGLVNTANDLAVKTDLYHGFIVSGGSARIVTAGVVNATSYPVSSTDELLITKEGSDLKFYINGSYKISAALPTTFTYKTGVFAAAAGTIIKYRPIRLLSLHLAWNKINPIKPGSCLGSFGSVSGSLQTLTFFTYSTTAFSAVLTNSSNVSQPLDAGSTAANYSFSNLLPGTYTLTVSFNWVNNSTSAITPTPVVFTTTVFVSSKMAWENLVEAADIPASQALFSTSTANGHATSVNDVITTSGVNSYIDFGVKLGGYLYQYFSGFSLMIPVGNGSTSMGFFDPSTTPVSNTIPPNFTGYKFYKTALSPFMFIAYQGGVITNSGTFLASDRFRFVYNSTNKQGSLYKLMPDGSLGGQMTNSTIQYSTLPASLVKKLIAYLATNSLNRGLIDVSTNMSCPTNFIYAKLEKQLKGVKYKVYLNKFYFFYDEEYASTSSLTYNVYDKNNSIVLNTTTQVLTHTVGTVNREYGDNRYSLDVTSLAAGSYILEVVNEKGEKLYLRFIK